MKSVFVLGAGLVSRPLVHYLLEKGYRVTLGDMNEAQAQAIVAGFAHGHAERIDIAEADKVSGFVAAADLVVSLLPPRFHIQLARLCLHHGKDFLTASYLSPEMEALDAEVRAKGLIFLNEIGLDPGLDHLTAMEMADQLKEQGFEITSFDSHCGGIPSRAAANNPLRYKLSWSPAGVLGALTRPARFRRNGVLKDIPKDEMLAHMEVLCIPGHGVFESTPNADSLFYGERYGLEGAATIRRGTLRFPGWAHFWRFMLARGFVDRERTAEFTNTQVFDALFQLAGQPRPESLESYIVEEAGSHGSEFLEKIQSLGLLDADNRVTGSFSAFDIVLRCMEATLQYAPGERDLVVLHHEMIAVKPGHREKWTSTIVREGSTQTTAMAFLVGEPAAIAARLILEKAFPQRGVLIPIAREIYAPILHELSERGLAHELVKTALVAE